MNKKSMLLTLALIAIVTMGLVVSCSDNIMDDVSDTLVWATFDRRGSRDVESSYTQTVTLTEMSSVYWTYTAVKKDTAGQTGASDTETNGTLIQTAVKSTLGAGLDGEIGPFSQGDWEFTVYGYKNGPDTKDHDNDKVLVGGTEGGNDAKYYSGLIYQNETAAKKTLKLTSGSDVGKTGSPDTIDVIINLLDKGKGTFAVSGASDFKWKVDSKAAYSNMYLTMLATKADKTAKSAAFALAYDSTSKSYKFAESETELSWNNYTAGSWTMTFAVVSSNGTEPSYTSNSWTNVSYTYATSPELTIKIYVGQTTTLSASIIEEDFAYGQFDGKIDSNEIVAISTVTATVNTSTGSAVLESNVSPSTVASASVSSETVTKVTIPEGTNELRSSTTDGSTTSSTASLTVTAYPIATANNKFKISAGGSSVGAIDLKATVTTTTTPTDGTSTVTTKDVDKFTTGDGVAQEVTVETKITAGLSNVTLTYTYSDGGETTETWNSTATSETDSEIRAPEDDEDGVCYYDKKTGKLVFKTTHFSTFIVVADSDAYIVSTGKAYSSLADALKDASSGDTIKILRDSTIETSFVQLGMKLSIDLNNGTLKVITPTEKETEVVGLFKLASGADLTIKNGSVATDSEYSNFQMFAVVQKANGVNLELDRVNVIAPSGIIVSDGVSNVNITVRNSEIYYGQACYGIASNASSVSEKGNVEFTIEDTTITPRNGYNGESTGLMLNVPTEVTISGSTIVGQRQGAILRGGEYTITGSAFEVTATNNTTYTDIIDQNGEWGVGNRVPIAALVIGNRTKGSYKYPTTVTFVGSGNKLIKNADATKWNDLYVYQVDEAYPVSVNGVVDEDWVKNTEMHGASYPGMQAKIGNYHYDTLKEAVAAAKENSTVTVLAGEWPIDSNEKKITVKQKGIKIIGEGNVTLVYSNLTGNGAFVVDDNADSVELSNVTFETSDESNNLTCEVVQVNGNYCRVENCKFLNKKTKYTALTVASGKSHTVTGCTFDGGFRQLQSWAAVDGGTVIKNCVFKNSRAYNINFQNETSGSISITIGGCSLSGWNSYAGVSPTFVNCVFTKDTYGLINAYQSTTFDGCSFSGDFGVYVATTEKDSKNVKFEFKNCKTSDGVEITVDNIKSSLTINTTIDSGSLGAAPWYGEETCSVDGTYVSCN